MPKLIFRIGSIFCIVTTNPNKIWIIILFYGWTRRGGFQLHLFLLTHSVKGCGGSALDACGEEYMIE
ncbi:hypothetical protein Lalb_Chr02g0154211 [Lupinus albus]|uniref:Uncharacterized protein n=1 Tax=Lupinus albus TaxID=3870 RepID=A0A6A4R0G3_LUPAL|nr:hypothetical protein Lalb_Chr02g0154211 [Lupinus albus]